MHSIWQTVTEFFRIVLLKSPPQDLPASTGVLYLSVMMAFLVGILRYAIVGGGYWSLFRSLLEVAVPGVILFFLLVFFKLPARFGQSFSALCGTSAIIYFFALPVLPAFHAAASNASYNLSVYLIIALDLWSLVVVAFILKHTLGVGFATGVSLAIAVGLSAFIVIESIAPVPDSIAPAQDSIANRTGSTAMQHRPTELPVAFHTLQVAG